MPDALRLVVGLRNPGQAYAETRHNAGAWFVERLALAHGIRLAPDRNFNGLVGMGQIGGKQIRLFLPGSYMNLSGQPVATLARYFKMEPREILVAHDELDLDPGIIRLKTGGGHGGHNGLRSIIQQLGQQSDFHRLRIGIGHPGDKSAVTDYVLGRPSVSDRQRIDAAIDEAIRLSDDLVNGEFNRVMNTLHAFKG
jgi:PTH1 family peptidyl-tRNA hydrolase